MADEFKYDVFLSHSAKDKAVVRPIAERLKKDGLRVWFDEWRIKTGDSIPAKVEEGLEHSRVLVLCMSANAFGSDWTQLESHTFRFRDPLNRERRFVPLRLDDAAIKSSLAQLVYINWFPADRKLEYAKLLEACQPPAKPKASRKQATPKQAAEKVIQLDYKDADIRDYAFSLDGKRVFTSALDHTVRLWDLETGQCLRILEGHTEAIWSIAWSVDQRFLLSASDDHTARLWDVETGRCLRVLKGHTDNVVRISWSIDERQALTGADDHTVRLWDVKTGRCRRVFEGHTGPVRSVAWSADQSVFLSGSYDTTLRLWNAKTGRCLRVFEGHTGWVLSIMWSLDRRRALSGSEDGTVRLWDVETGRCLRVFKGHAFIVVTVAWSADEQRILSGSWDETVRLWDVRTGRCLRLLKGHTCTVWKVAWSADGQRVYSGDECGGIRVWNLPKSVTETRTPPAAMPALPFSAGQVQYTNAKVLLVGESGVGKTGLSKRLASNKWEPSDSTVGAWATQWKVPVASSQGVQREIWLWDFGGQADQRLIHQLYMDETALAVLVFDGQKEDVFETLGQWDHDLARASRKEFAKLLVAGRVDAGGLRVSRSEVEKFAAERKFRGFLETSAKKNKGCRELRKAILAAINWDEIPCRTTKVLFKRLKEEIIGLKDEGRVLMRFNELRETLQLRLSGEFKRFADEELRAVLTLLAGPGVVWELAFGSWVLLQPERINAYAQAVIQTVRADEFERGCIAEERVLKGDLTYHSSIARLEADEERFVLLAMHQTLVERALCIRQITNDGMLLIFPSYYRRERPELVTAPAVQVSYRFHGFLDEIYATLVVKLHHTQEFKQDQLWRYAADFKAPSGKQLGVKLTHLAEGEGELEVYFDPAIKVGEKIIFSKYVHEHLLQNAKDVVRLRHYVCPHCGTPVGNPKVAMRKLEEGKRDIPCMECDDPDKRIPLWDPLEELYASPEMKKRVRELEGEAALVLTNEGKERTLVGEVISTVALAGQLCREFNVSDKGIDMEIEFNDDAGRATGRKLYLQLKSGDSYLSRRKSDGARIFTIKDERHAHYWMAQAFPVMLVIRTSDGEVRGMRIDDYLKRESDNGKKPVKQIVFQGDPFNVMAVRRWRDWALGQGSA